MQSKPPRVRYKNAQRTGSFKVNLENIPHKVGIRSSDSSITESDVPLKNSSENHSKHSLMMQIQQSRDERILTH